MKPLYAFFLFLLPLATGAQTDTITPPVTFQFTSKKINDNAYTLFVKATIANGWKLFSTTATSDELHTNIALDSPSMAMANIQSMAEKGSLEKKQEPLLDGATIQYFQQSVVFEVTLQLTQTKTSKKDITGNIHFMALKGDSVIGPEATPFRLTIDDSGNWIVANTTLTESAAGKESIKRSKIDIHHPVHLFGGTGGEATTSKTWWHIFLLGILGGLVGLIMPCTFPMIPLTVSFFTKKAPTKRQGIVNAFMYGFFIFLIYILLSVPFYFLDAGSSAVLNNISTNAWLNIFFAIIFIVFAVSFFGYFEITLPARFSNTADAKSGVSSIIGIFFMALTLAIVSFSCTGPILGSLLVGALHQNGGAAQLTIAMAGFGLALGLPFGLFALFPQWLSRLPKSGGWMDTVKVVFGFVELAFAIKFISNADLVQHGGWLKREVFLGIWIVIGIAIVLYLLGSFKFKNETPLKKISVTRWIFIVVFAAITLYLIPGVTKTRYANLSLLSGITPPLSYSLYGKSLIAINGVEARVINDYEQALALAKKENKPLLLDFTGWACANCRRMEENVWIDPPVKNLIANKFILVSLYVDDRKILPISEQFLYASADGSKKNIKTIGDKYSTFQSENFGNASQPLYALISPAEQLLNLPIGYTPNKKEYLKWLQNGLEAGSKTSR
jgi:thiol:disulfide interchange protein